MKSVILASASVLAIAAVPARAQTSDAQDAPVPQSTAAANAPQGAAPSSVSDEQTGLQEIVVTAQRREESAQKAPIAVAVIKAEDVVRLDITRSEDLSKAVPALVATASGGPNTSFFIRGVGNTTANSFSDPAISFNYDGVTIGRPNATQGFFFDLQRVEVLKGPQGTLYGRNATGGAVNVIPNRPKIGVTEGEFQASYRNYDAIQGQGAVNIPIGEYGAFRLSGALSKHDGYLSDGTSDQDSKSVRAQVLANFTPNLTTRIAADYAHQGGAGTGSFIYGTYAFTPALGRYVFTPQPSLGPTVGVHDPRSEAFVQTRFIAQVGRNSEPTNTYPRTDNFVWGVTNETNWRTDAGTLTVQAAYRSSTTDSLSTTSSFRGFLIDENTDQTTLEARWAGKAGAFADYLFGLYLFDEDTNSHSAIDQFVTTPFLDYKTGTNSKAAFGRVSIHPFDGLTLTAAGRYTADKKYINGANTQITLNCGNPQAPPQDLCPGFPLLPLVKRPEDLIAFYTANGIISAANPVNAPAVLNRPRVLRTVIPAVFDLDVNKFTYRLAADYQITPSNLVYASYETGFHSGGFNFAVGLETYRPETIRAWTVGTKNRFLDNRVQLNVEGFYWKYRDQQVSQFGVDFATPPNQVFYATNIGRSTIKGIDVDLDALVTPTTRFAANIQYLDTSYDSFAFSASPRGPFPNYDRSACAITGGVVGATPATDVNYAIDCSGAPALFSPKWTLYYNLEQTFRLDGFKLVAQGGTRWRSNYFAATSFQPWAASQNGFQSDASLTLAPDSDRWFISAFVNNIENTRRLTQSNVNGNISVQSGVATAPRTYGLRLGARFK